jgi:hypothetical protein
MRLELKELNYSYPGSVTEVFRQLNCEVTEQVPVYVEKLLKTIGK